MLLKLQDTNNVELISKQGVCLSTFLMCWVWKEIQLKVTPFFTSVMHYTALSALLMRHHNSPKIQDLLRRVNKETLIGTVSYSDPATGECCFVGNV